MTKLFARTAVAIMALGAAACAQHEGADPGGRFAEEEASGGVDREPITDQAATVFR